MINLINEEVLHHQQRELFTPAGLQGIFECARNNGLNLVNLETARGISRPLIVRSDIDFRPDLALDFAQQLKDLGVSATFMVRPLNQHYNVFDPATGEGIAQIHDLGHNLGLHYSLANIPGVSPEEQFIKQYFSMLMFLTEYRLPAIQSAAQHIVTRATVPPLPERVFRKFGLINAFNPMMCPREEGGYISDSRGIFKFGEPIGRLQTIAEKMTSGVISTAQILLHPEWWSDRSGTMRGYFLSLADQDLVNPFPGPASTV